MDASKRNISLVSSPEFCSESTDEDDTSWTESSCSNESLIALSTFPPRSNHATRYKPSRNPCASSFLDDRGIYSNDLMCSCDYGSIESRLPEKNRQFHKGLLSSSEHCGANRYDYDHFPPYRDKGHSKIVETIIDKCNIITSRFSHYFKRKLNRDDPEQTSLLPKENQYLLQSQNVQSNESQPDHSLNSTIKFGANNKEGNTQFEEEYETPPRWRGSEYLEWLGLLGQEGSSGRQGHSLWETKSSPLVLTPRREFGDADRISPQISKNLPDCLSGMTLSFLSRQRHICTCVLLVTKKFCNTSKCQVHVQRQICCTVQNPSNEAIYIRVMKCSRFYCYFNLEMITKISCRVVQFIQCSDVASTRVQKRMFCKQNIILPKCSFTVCK